MGWMLLCEFFTLPFGQSVSCLHDLSTFLLPNIWYLYSFSCQSIYFLLKFLACKLYRNVVLIFCPLVDPLGWQISSCIPLWTENILSIILTFWVYWDSCYGLEYGQFCLMVHVILKKVHLPLDEEFYRYFYVEMVWCFSILFPCLSSFQVFYPLFNLGI